MREDTYENEVSGGLLHIILGDDAPDIANQLRRRIIRWVAMEDADSMEKIFRCSRMCWELSRGNELTDVDREDIGVLLSLSLDASSGTEKLFATLNKVEWRVHTSEMNPKTVHEASMSVFRSMSE
jgi:hypothetical protein